MKAPRDHKGLPITAAAPPDLRDAIAWPGAPDAVAPPSAGIGGSSGAPRRDVEERDLHELLTAFYDTVELEPLLAPYFAVVDMEAHMPRIVDFWSTLLWHTGRYSGNAFRPHLDMAGLTGEHFARWLSTLERTIDARFAGPSAERMKALGHRIAYSMQLRLGIPPFEEDRPVGDGLENGQPG